MTEKYSSAKIIYLNKKDLDKWYFPEEEYKKFIEPTIVFIDLKNSFTVLFFNEGIPDYNEYLSIEEIIDIYNSGSGIDTEIKTLKKELKQSIEMLLRRL